LRPSTFFDAEIVFVSFGCERILSAVDLLDHLSAQVRDLNFVMNVSRRCVFVFDLGLGGMFADRFPTSISLA
jgi:hypothetical protein